MLQSYKLLASFKLRKLTKGRRAGKKPFRAAYKSGVPPLEGGGTVCYHNDVGEAQERAGDTGTTGIIFPESRQPIKSSAGTC